MHRKYSAILALLATGVMICTAAGVQESQPSDGEQYTLAPGNPDYDAMPDSSGKDEVFSYCSACHSMKLVTQQHLSRKRWARLLDWMVDEQGMTPLGADDRKLVLDYLARHYGSKSEPRPRVE